MIGTIHKRCTPEGGLGGKGIPVEGNMGRNWEAAHLEQRKRLFSPKKRVE